MIIKKIFTVLAVIVGVCSLVLNYFIIFDSPLQEFLNNEERLKKTSAVALIIGNPITTKPILNDHSDDPAIRLMDSTIVNLNTIAEELTATSGGVDVNGDFMNAYGVIYVNTYFYDENYYRNNAIEYFEETLLNYLNITDSLNIESGLKRKYKLTSDYYGGLNFKKFTVAESNILLQSLCQQILADKYSYLLRKDTTSTF